MVPSAGAPAAPTYPAERDPILLEDDGRDEGHLVPQEGITALGAPGEEPWSRKDGRQSGGPELSRPLLGSIRLPSGLRLQGNKMHTTLPVSEPRAKGGPGPSVQQSVPPKSQMGCRPGHSCTELPSEHPPHKTRHVARAQSLSRGNRAAGETGHGNRCSQPREP